jgi:PEGA domain
MTRKFIGTLALASGVVALAALPAAAGQRPNTSGESTGTAVPRGGDGGGTAGSSGSSSSSSSSSGGSVSNASSGSSGGDHSMPMPAARSSYEAPSRSNDQGSRSRTGSSSGTATTRGGSSNSGSSSPRSASSSPSTEHAASSGDSGSRRAVPEFSRPRDGRPVTGEATNRTSFPPVHPSNPIVIYPYDPWGYWGGYGFGLGYLYYDPFGYGSYGYGYGDPYGGYGYGGGYSGGGGYSVSQSYRENGGLRLKINPKQAQVFVDGAYVGVIDSFNGTFQKLEIESGGHKVELKANGFEPLQFDVLIPPGETVIYKGEMKKIR